MKKWNVWFRQVNQIKLEVEARTEESAIRKAEREWKKDYGIPDLYCVEYGKQKGGKGDDET